MACLHVGRQNLAREHPVGYGTFHRPDTDEGFSPAVRMRTVATTLSTYVSSCSQQPHQATSLPFTNYSINKLFGV